MRRVIPILLCGLAVATARGELRPPERTLQPVVHPSMVVIDRGAELEVLATKRATLSLDSSTHRVIHQVTTAKASAPIGPHQLGVVFNHAMQAQGYITGEIAFKVKGDQKFDGNSSLFPGLKQITTPAVYVVNARTPAEFIQLLKRLQARPDLEWVEPTVTYGLGSGSGSVAAP